MCVFEPLDCCEWDVGGHEVLGFDDPLEALESELVQNVAVLVVHEDLADVGADEEFFAGG